ncbi:MAG TPA: efflux RND transporter periplasmic adaptor subunit [Vicinamibacteria bacterium]|nr:efflux RND transporter periplasmic adaptor subunit [Vicinamibacteria bacterium]
MRCYRFIQAIFLPFLAGVAANSCSQKSGDSSASEGLAADIPVVEAVEARFGSLPLSERLNGTIVADNQVALYPEMSGRVVRVEVRDGDEVQRGDPLVYLEDRMYSEQLQQARATYNVNQAALKQAQARLQELEAYYKRTQMLAAEGLASQSELETLEAQMAAARASIELAEAQIQQSQSATEESKEILSKMVVRAPITGTVGQRNAEVGMQVSQNTQLFTIGNLEELKIRVVLTEEMLHEIGIGEPARVQVATGGQQRVLEAQISRISPFLDPLSRSTEAEIDLQTPDPSLKPGMFVPVDILYGESRQATLVPASAIDTNSATGEEGVYLLPDFGSREWPPGSDDGESEPSISPPTEIRFQPVRVVAQGRMEVGVEGLEPGVWVVTVGQNLLSGGVERARVQPTSWEHILGLQGLERQDLLRQVLESQP